MWYKMIEQSHFLKSLYNQIPKLENIRIEGIYIKEEGRKITLHFDMPFYAENIPKKWAELGYNSVALQVDFFKIYSLEMNTVSDTYRGNIDINKDEKGLLEISVTGEIRAKIKADYGFIQSINGYINGAI
ncbi:Imm50 family immunity protein [Bacillus subtilis]|uniref:Imm50 family immunity protein n=1 Tax=Bacillus subtilis TaxID=1423 RepID=UPI00240D94C3|nr:Imm50 family immunity protein [Bacillus subtilis]WEZ61652.1 Imm50 family immunity protein [Bacillus subtilis]